MITRTRTKRIALLLAVVLSVAMLAASATAFAATTTATPSPAKTSLCRLYLNGKLQGANPYYKGSTLMVPLRAVTENAGWVYSHSKGVSTFGANGKSFSVTLGKNLYTFGGKTYKFPYAPELTDNRVYVPWQYLELALGQDVTIAADGRIDVKAPKINPTMYSLVVNGKKTSALPYKSGKTLMLPLREISQRLGYAYSYSNSLRRSLISAKGIDTEIKWDSKLYPIDNEMKPLEIKPAIKFGAVCVPASFIEQGLKATVTQKGYVIYVTR